MGSYVVTGAARGIGRAIAERLATRGPVVALDADAEALAWTEDAGLIAIAGDAGDEAVAERAADAAEAAAPLAGWVNNAALFRDAALHDTPAADVLALIAANLGLAVAGCAVAVRRFLAAGTAGAIVNVSSHQAQRPGAGRAALRDREGGGRGADARAGGRLRPARDPRQRGRARQRRHRAARGRRRRRRRRSARCTRSAAPAAPDEVAAVVAHLLEPGVRLGRGDPGGRRPRRARAATPRRAASSSPGGPRPVDEHGEDDHRPRAHDVRPPPQRPDQPLEVADVVDLDAQDGVRLTRDGDRADDLGDAADALEHVARRRAVGAVDLGDRLEPEAHLGPSTIAV